MFVIHVPELSTLEKYTSCSIQFMVTHSHVVLKYIRPYVHYAFNLSMLENGKM